MYNAYITKIKDIRPHNNADRLNIGYAFGNSVIIGKDYDEETLYIYFPTDGQLSEEYCRINDLIRRKDEFGNDAGGYLDPDKRKVSTIRLRGEISDGLLMPLASLASFGDISQLKQGDTVEIFNGHLIAQKYIPRKVQKQGEFKVKEKKKKENHFPTFAQHVDTSQLAYNLGQFKEGDELILTLKMHGTSARTGYLQREEALPQNWLQRFLRKVSKIVKSYEYITGTRRVTLENMNENTGFYGSHGFRKKWHDSFVGKLQKNETIYGEIVGYTETGASIMPSCDNKKLKDKEFIKKYGEYTNFSYGCSPEGPLQNDFYVYRMTMTNEDGYVVEYPWDLVKARCEQMGVKHVPELDRVVIKDFEEWMSHDGDGSPGNMAKEIAEEYFSGPDLVDPRHIREGVVVRINNVPTFKAFKHKNQEFKILEGIAKLEAEEPDMEEAEDDFN